MKRSLLILVALLVPFLSFSQDILRGPAAKNAKIGKLSSMNLSLVFDNNPTRYQGPQAKNFKAWTRQDSSVPIRTRKVISHPKGLQAKSKKVWKESESNQTNSRAAYELPKSMRKRKIWWH